jgi:hypothetical protein
MKKVKKLKHKHSHHKKRIQMRKTNQKSINNKNNQVIFRDNSPHSNPLRLPNLKSLTNLTEKRINNKLLTRLKQNNRPSPL